MGLFADPESEKTGGVNANLRGRIALLVVGVGFIAWSRLRPIVVPEHVEPVTDDPTRPAPKKSGSTRRALRPVGSRAWAR